MATIPNEWQRVVDESMPPLSLHRNWVKYLTNWRCREKVVMGIVLSSSQWGSLMSCGEIDRNGSERLVNGLGADWGDFIVKRFAFKAAAV